MIRYIEPTDWEFLHDIDIKSYDFRVWDMHKFMMTDTYVYVASERVVAFLSWERWKEELLILKLGVTPSFRRQGIGTNLINSVLSRGLVTNCVVFEESLAGQLMLKNNGFKFLRTATRDDQTLYLMENRNGIDYNAGSELGGCFPSDDSEMGGHGDSGQEIAGFESPSDYP